MPAFRYEAADAAGKTDKGVIEADSARQARTLLRARGLTPLLVDALEPGILYRFRVRAFNAVGWSEWSERIARDVRTYGRAPDVPPRRPRCRGDRTGRAR